MRVVIDTNVFISAAILPHSISAKTVAWCLSYSELYFSDSTFLELSSRILKAKFDQYTSTESRQTFVKKIRDAEHVIFCTPQETFTDSIDPDDNQFLDVAVECRADFLITGDKKHLLPLHPYQGIQIIQPHDFMKTVLDQ